MIGHTIAIYNGKEHFPILISDQMIGYMWYLEIFIIIYLKMYICFSIIKNFFLKFL